MVKNRLKSSKSRLHQMAWVTVFLSGLYVEFGWGHKGQAHDLNCPFSHRVLKECPELIVRKNDEKPNFEKRALYIMGGAYNTQLLKFQKAARLYKQEDVHAVWVIHADGITAYDNKSGRNPTENEWAVGG